ncbi:gliding motility-associated C-terminal domain-containing protein [Arachidicoccus ginsenosidivorans]
MPSAFSPNGDGLNDVFRIEGITYQVIKKFVIYNKFGQIVFSTYNNNNGWDGTQNGKPCDMGTYYYLIKVACRTVAARHIKEILHRSGMQHQG